MRECSMGNFLADAALQNFIEQPTDRGWNFVAIALWNSGGIRASINERTNKGSITFEDVLEASIRNYDLDIIDPAGNFLQVSGLRLTYNVSQPIGSRLIKADARCTDCRIPEYRPLDDEQIYWVVMNKYMIRGGDNFGNIQKNAIFHRRTDDLDVDVIIKYAQEYSPITTGLENRITVISSRDNEPPSTRTFETTTEIFKMDEDPEMEMFLNSTKED
ncbi:5'-nucleotidase [Caerostris extrusa]|uniref:5'-nucleotidase n=1 Tax=Caerostris extrusa TaxID=172846 RepID=A0AAV4RB61_CAEEX|nr:5'-nucleotidase [Caerostris extrusa]